MSFTKRILGRGRRALVVAGVGAAALALAACGGGGGADPLADSSGSPSAAGGGKVIVGSADFTESQILGELYAQAMAAKGVDASTKPGIGSREVYIKALQDNSISVVPEYTGNLLLYFDPQSTATTEAEIAAALPKAVGSDLKILEPSQAQDQDVYVVTKQTSEEKGITSLDDLKKISSTSILGGPAELQDRAYGPPGLEKIYGATFKQFKPYAAPAVKVKDLNDNKIQVASFFTTEAAIPDNGYVHAGGPAVDDPAAERGAPGAGRRGHQHGRRGRDRRRAEGPDHRGADRAEQGRRRRQPGSEPGRGRVAQVQGSRLTPTA